MNQRKWRSKECPGSLESIAVIPANGANSEEQRWILPVVILRNPRARSDPKRDIEENHSADFSRVWIRPLISETIYYMYISQALKKWWQMQSEKMWKHVLVWMKYLKRGMPRWTTGLGWAASVTGYELSDMIASTRLEKKSYWDTAEVCFSCIYSHTWKEIHTELLRKANSYSWP